MTSAQTAFRPSEHGFRFPNRFKFSHTLILPLVGAVELGEIVYGLCGGMCFASVDYYHTHRPVPKRTTVPPSGGQLRKYLTDRQIHSLVPPAGIEKVIKWTLEDDKYVAQRTADREFGKLRKELAADRPATLALIRVNELGQSTKNHQVVAVGYEFDEASQELTIDLYDPNYPMQQPSLQMTFTDPSGSLHASQSTGEPLRGFFVIDYKPRTPP